MTKVNKSFESTYPFYNSATGKMVARALCMLVIYSWGKELINPLNRFAVIGEADFLLPILPEDTVFCNECKEKYLHLPQKKFSHVIAFNFFKDKANEKHFVKELHRITTDDGKVIFIAAKKNGFWTYDDSMPFKESVQYTDSELKHLFGEVGFDNVTFGKALLLPPALYSENFAFNEQKFKPFLSWLAGATAVIAQKNTLAVARVATPEKTTVRKKKKAARTQTAITFKKDENP